MTTKESESQLDVTPVVPDTSRKRHSEDGQNSEPSSVSPETPTAILKTEVDDEDAGVDTKTMANAPFVNKVWRIVNDPANFQYIRWVPGGKSIQIVDREGFEKQLLPYYFKHKRFTSFVRQLNMYGWHKVQDLSAGTMQSSEEHWQFANPNFIQGHPELLQRIVRNKGHKVGASNGGNGVDTWREPTKTDTSQTSNGGGEKEKGQDLKNILRELEQIKSRQIHIGEDLGRMRKDNELLWAEYYQTRERYDKHSQMLSRILQFLATVYGNQSKILDLSDPNTPAGAAAAERILRGPMDSTQQQSYLGLLPANEGGKLTPAESFKTNSMHDLREIEQMQNQIEEANTPSSSASGRDSFSADGAAYREGTPSFRTGYVAPTNRETDNLKSNNNGANPTIPETSRALIPSRHSSQALLAVPFNNNPLENRVTPLNDEPNVDFTGKTNPLPQTNNTQLVRANNNPRFAPSSLQGPLAVPQPSNNARQYQSPQLQEIPNDFDDPDKLFPELQDFSASGSLAPLTSQELEQISREVASNGMSLQNIQDWLNKQNLDDEDQFNVDDFLDTGEDKTRAASPSSTPQSTRSKGSNDQDSAEPSMKRVRVS